MWVSIYPDLEEDWYNYSLTIINRLLFFREVFGSQQYEYRHKPYTPHPHQWVVSPIVNILRQSGTFIAVDKPTLTHYYHLKIIVHIKVYSWCCRFYGF